MNTTLAQALQLTVLGMGMTFASIGVLALGMFLMTRMVREKDKASTQSGTLVDSSVDTAAVTSAGTPDDNGIGMSDMTDRSKVDGAAAEVAARAAAAAVAVTLATCGAAQAAAAAVAVALSEDGVTKSQAVAPALGVWDGYVRSMHLSRRARYDARRGRG